MKSAIALALAFSTAAIAAAADTFPVQVSVDAAQSTGPLRRFWRYFGADEPNYATMKDGQKLLGQIGELAPDETPYASLESVSALATLTDAPAEVSVASGSVTLEFNLPRQGVSLIVLEWTE